MSRPQTYSTGEARAGHPPRLRLAGLKRRFGKTAAVDDVSLDVDAGEVVCLLGPSGCGKTTTLRIAAGGERADAGRVEIDGRLVAGDGVYVPPERRGVGLMFQDFALFPHLTAAGNVAFGLAGLEARERARRIKEALARVRLGGHAKAYPHELSGGEQQRLALARALAPGPAVLLMDEPFSGLDRELRASVRRDTLDILRGSGAASLIVTHDPEEALQTADRIVLMRQGRVVQAGPPEELWRRPVDAGAAEFFGEINRIPVVVRAGWAETPWGAVAAGGRPDGPASAVVRPEDLKEGGPGAPILEVEGVQFLGGVYRVEGRLLAQNREAKLAARLAKRLSPSPGDKIPLVCEPNAILIFAPES